MHSPDVCVAGAGIIGLTLAGALSARGLSVLVLEAGNALEQASTAAAGMLAVDDPANPHELLALARHSRNLYPALIDTLSTAAAPLRFQTHRTLQAVPSPEPAAIPPHDLPPSLVPGNHRFFELAEQSLDPRQLAAALLRSLDRSPRIALATASPVLSVHERHADVLLRTPDRSVSAAHFVDCTGAWSLSTAHVPSVRVVPRKGQMLTVPTPAALAPGLVLRTEAVYLVPRLHGEHAGATVLGASVEDAGFDRTVHPAQLQNLVTLAAALLPELASTPILSSWAGLRPATADLLPLLGTLPGFRRLHIASGHYRNGILLAPGTAEVMAQLLSGDSPAVPLEPFAPARRLPARPVGSGV